MLARVVLRTNRLSSAGPLLNELHWLPVASRIQFKIATLTHKILSTGTPSYLSSLLSPYKPTRQLRSSSSNLLVQPPSKTKFGSLAFHTAAPLIWNGLPADVRSSPSFQTSKKMLKLIINANVTNIIKQYYVIIITFGKSETICSPGELLETICGFSIVSSSPVRRHCYTFHSLPSCMFLMMPKSNNSDINRLNENQSKDRNNIVGLYCYEASVHHIPPLPLSLSFSFFYFNSFHFITNLVSVTSITTSLFLFRLVLHRFLHLVL